MCTSCTIVFSVSSAFQLLFWRGRGAQNTLFLGTKYLFKIQSRVFGVLEGLACMQLVLLSCAQTCSDFCAQAGEVVLKVVQSTAKFPIEGLNPKPSTLNPKS